MSEQQYQPAHPSPDTSDPLLSRLPSEPDPFEDAEAEPDVFDEADDFEGDDEPDPVPLLVDDAPDADDFKDDADADELADDFKDDFKDAEEAPLEPDDLVEEPDDVVDEAEDAPDDKEEELPPDTPLFDADALFDDDFEDDEDELPQHSQCSTSRTTVIAPQCCPPSIRSHLP